MAGLPDLLCRWRCGRRIRHMDVDGMTRGQIIKQAFDLVAHATGQLSLAIGKNKMGRRPLTIIVADLRNAANLIESALNAQD
jgi:hypothetical protein